MVEGASDGLAGRVAAITGAASGLGYATAQLLTARGARVVVLDVDEAAGARVADELGPDALFVPCDVTRADAVEAAAAEVERAAGGCDVLVNNAGVMTKAPLLEETVEAWDRMMAVNVRGYFLCTQAFGRRMAARGGGRIVNVASIGAGVPTEGAGAYCVGKAGVVALTRQCALELGPLGIRTNAVSPGYMRTAMTAANYAVPGLEQRRSSLIPLRRIAEVEEVAAAIAYLAGDDASYVNGVEIVVDGGFRHSTTRAVPHHDD